MKPWSVEIIMLLLLLAFMAGLAMLVFSHYMHLQETAKAPHLPTDGQIETPINPFAAQSAPMGTEGGAFFF